MADESLSRCGEPLPRRTVPSLARGLVALQAFSPETPRLSMSELVSRLRAPRASVARLAQSLVDLGFLCLDANGRLMPGPASMRVADAYLQNLPILEYARPVLDALSTQCMTSAQLLAHDGNEAVVIAQSLPHTIDNACMATRVGARFPVADVAAPAVAGGVLLLSDEGCPHDDPLNEDQQAATCHVDIVARPLAPWPDTAQRFSLGLPATADARRRRALDAAVQTLNALGCR
ncbi:helix-turn-helix domain-containing protein [Paraburkholderia strydomiana]